MLLGRSRYGEFRLFLDWLLEKIVERQIDVLLVAGDVFDTQTPGPRVQRLYYEFLHRLSGTGCRHVVVIGGNHDSPQLLDAPGELLRRINVHVVGGVDIAGDGCANVERELLLLRGNDGAPELIVCAVPFLREREISWSEAGDSATEKERRLTGAIRDHYAEIAEKAGKLRAEIEREHGTRLPIVGMGHLFAVAARERELFSSVSENDAEKRCSLTGEGVRELYVGSLGAVDASHFPADFDYMALGHLHIARRVGSETVRYSGSPLPMGFGEGSQRKYLVESTYADGAMSVGLIEVPRFSHLVSIAGSREEIREAVEKWKTSPLPVWMDVRLTEPLDSFGLQKELDAWTAGTPIDILRFFVPRPAVTRMSSVALEIDMLDEHHLFKRRLDRANIPENDREPYVRRYKEILFSLAEESRANNQ